LATAALSRSPSSESDSEVASGDGDHELLAAPPGDDGLRSATGPQPRGHYGEDGIPDHVATGVVDLLEAVEIGHEHAERSGLWQEGQSLLQVAAVADARERVRGAELCELLGM
jgi:hypothetical protein